MLNYKTKCKPVLITIIYRPPNAKVDWENKESIMLGDFNCDLLSTKRGYHTSRLLDLISLYQLTQLIANPTPITENTETLLDIVLTNMPEIAGTTQYSDEIQNNGNSEYCQHISFVEHLRFN